MNLQEKTNKQCIKYQYLLFIENIQDIKEVDHYKIIVLKTSCKSISALLSPLLGNTKGTIITCKNKTNV